MQAEKESKPKKRKICLILGLLLALSVILLLSVFFLVPAFLSSEKGRQTILSKINDSIEGETRFASLSMSWWKGIKVTDLVFNDTAGQTSVKVKQIATKPHYASLLRGSLSFGETLIEKPQVEIKLERAAPGAEEVAAKTPRESQGRPVMLPVKRMELLVSDGSFKVSDAKAASVELLQINSRVNLRPPGRETDFEIDMKVAGEGAESKVGVKGQIKPKRTTGWTMKGTSGELTVEVNDLELGSLGPIFKLAGIDIDAKGRLSTNIKSEIKDGHIKKASGSVKGKGLDISGEVLKGDHLKSGLWEIALELQSGDGVIDIKKLEVHSDWAQVSMRGTVPTTFESLAELIKPESKYDLKGSFDCDVAAILSSMPNTFGVKEGMEVTSGRLNGVIETFSEEGRRRITGQGNLVGMEGKVEGRKIAISQPVRAEVAISADKTAVRYDKLDLSSSFAQINFSGSSKELNYEAKVDLAKMQGELGQFIDMGPYQITGEVVEKGTLSGTKDKITAAGSAVLKDIGISSKDGRKVFEPSAKVVFSLAVEPDDRIASIESLKTEASFGILSTEDAVLSWGEKPAKPMHLPISANIDLAKLQPFVVFFGNVLKEMELAGTAESEVLVGFDKGVYHIATDATRIKNLRLSSPDKEPFAQEEVSVIFDGDFHTAAENLVIRKFELTSPDIKIKGSFEQEIKAGQTRLQGEAECEYDWAFVSTFLPKDLKVKGQSTNTIDFSTEYPIGKTEGILANLTVSPKRKLAFESADYMGLKFSRTEADIQIENGVLTIAPFSATVNNGQLNFAGEADFNRSPRLFKTEGPIQILKNIQINDEMGRKLLTYVNPIFAKALDVNGVANFNCERLAIPLSEVNANDIEVVGTVAMDEVNLRASDLLGKLLSATGASLRNQKVTIHPTRFVLEKGYLRYEDMQVDIGDNPINFQGVIGLDKSLDMKVTLPFTTRGRTVRVGSEDLGDRVIVPLKGTTDEPQLDLGGLLEDQLKKKLEEELRKGLEGLFK